MSDTHKANPKQLNRIIDFAVLGVTFFASCMLFSVDLNLDLLFQVISYATILLICVRLCKRAIVSYDRSIGEASRQILGNATGIIVGTGVVLVLEKLVSAGDEIFVAAIFSGVMAFFILGTLSPIVHKAPAVHRRSSPF